MLWRISAALAALYFVHGSDNVARDAGRAANEIAVAAPAIGAAAPKAALAYCLDKPEICRTLAREAAGLPAAGPVAAHAEANAVPDTAPRAVPAGAYPLPPRRPAAPAHKRA